ncbi:MAG: PEP-CTERM sorting domain-containing protein [Myxococcota bacterium]
MRAGPVRASESRRLRVLGAALFLVVFASGSAQATPSITIDEFTWNESTGVASITGNFHLDSYTGEQWRLVHLEIQVGSYVYATSLAPYPTYSSAPFTYDFEDVEISPAPLTVGNSYNVGIKMQRYFSWLPGWDSGTIFRQMTVVTAVPEPGTALLLAMGLLGLGIKRQRA